MCNRLVPLDHAIAHLKYPSVAALAPEDVADLERKLDAATELVLDYVRQRLGDTSATWAATVDAWTWETAPKRVLAAVVAMLGELDAHRGDEDAPGTVVAGELPPRVVTLLYRLRDPGIAV